MQARVPQQPFALRIGRREARPLAVAILACLAVLWVGCAGPSDEESGAVQEAREGGAEENYEQSLRSAILAVSESRARRAGMAVERVAARAVDPSQRAVARAFHHYVSDRNDPSGVIEEALELAPEEPALHFLAGMIRATSCDAFDPNGVILHLEKAIEGGLDLPSIRTGLIEAYDMKRMNNWSLSRAERYRALHPDVVQASAEVGLVRIARGEYGDALEAADEIVRSGEDVYAHGLAPAFILSGRHEEVAAMYDPEMEGDSTPAANVLTHLHAGINRVWTGRLDEAIRHFERGPEFLQGAWQASSRSLFLLLLGRTLQIQGRFEEAEAALREARREVETQPLLEYAAGFASLRSGRLEDARLALEHLSDERRRSLPGWSEPWRWLLAGEIALATGDVDAALDAFREAWRLEEPLALDCVVGSVDAYFLDALGRSWMAAGHQAEAFEAFERILALGPRGLHQPEIVIFAWYRSGLALAAMGRQDEADRRFTRFVGIWGDAPHAPPEVALARKRLDLAGS